MRGGLLKENRLGLSGTLDEGFQDYGPTGV